MPHINLPPKIPGIRSLALFRPETGKHLYALAQALLRNESPLSPAERELIAAYVSSLNRCRFCTDSHAAAARILYGDRGKVVTEVLQQVETASISHKLKALLIIAKNVQESGRNVSQKMIEKARTEGAEDREIHDTVLISATFCMFNRYVDGLATLTPTGPETYEEMGKHLARNGYVSPEKTTDMAYIQIDESLPGIRGLMHFRPETSQPLNNLAEVLLRGENTLSRGDRELIATFVSYLNGCFFCQHAHGGIARHYLQCDTSFLDSVKEDFRNSPISEKLKALLAIAGSVQKGGKNVTIEQVNQARELGATDLEIHDTVLISAAFCMFNRYVDGLGTWAPSDPDFYTRRGKQRAEEGYANYDPKN